VDPDKAGRRHAPRDHPAPSQEAADDLNHSIFRLAHSTDGVCGGSSPASRSFVLATLRALHLDPNSGPPARCRYENEAKQEQMTNGLIFTGVPNTDKGNLSLSTTTLTPRQRLGGR
jgi:hypothetical protein